MNSDLSDEPITHVWSANENARHISKVLQNCAHADKLFPVTELMIPSEMILDSTSKWNVLVRKISIEKRIHKKMFDQDWKRKLISF